MGNIFTKKAAYSDENFNSLVQKAIENENYHQVKILIEKELRRSKFIDLTSELTAAVAKGRPDIVELIHPYYTGNPKLIPKIAILETGPQFTDCIRILLKHGFTVKAKDRDMRPFMHSLLRNGYENDIFNTLMTHGVDVNLVNYQTGYTLLHTACLMNRGETILLLINNKCDVNAKITNGDGSNVNERPRSRRLMGKTALFIAVDKADIEMTKFLLANGANANDSSDILANAVDKGPKELVEILLEYGADVNAVNAYGKTPLHYCASKFPGHSLDFNKSEIAKLLLKKGANVNATTQSGNTPLFNATMCGYTKVVENLLEYGADVFVDKNGYTLLHIALEKGYYEILVMLLNIINQSDRKMLLNAQENNGQTPLHVGSKVKNANFRCIEIFLNSDIDVNLVDNDGKTALHLAAEAQNINIVEALLEKHARININDKNGQTAFHRAVEAEWHGISSIKLLLSHGANINAVENNGKVPLHFACDNKNAEAVDYLLKHNARVNVKDKNDQTPLHYACNKNSKCQNRESVKTVKLLLEHEAYVSCIDSDGNTPLHYTVENGCILITKLLLMAGTDINIVNKNNELAIDNICKEIHFTFFSMSNNSKIGQILREHIIKLKMANLKVCEKNVDFACNVNGDDNLEWVRSCENACTEEINRMKDEKFDGNDITYYDFLGRDINYRVNFTFDEDVMMALMSDNLNELFPLYADILKSRFVEARKRCELYEQIREYMNTCFIKFLPDICFDEIFHYFNINELETFVNAVKPSSAYRRV